MKFRYILYSTILLFLCNIGETLGLLMHGDLGNSTDTNHGFPGHNVELPDIMQMLLNQTAELENLKQQIIELETLKQKTAEIDYLKQQTENLKRQSENDRLTIQLLLNQTNDVETFKIQAEIDRSTIQVLQNRVFLLEVELNKLNISKLPSSQEFSTYLKSINQLTQNMAVNEANDKNVSQRLNDAVKALDDLKLKDLSLTQQLLNQSVELKQQSAQDRYSIHFLQNETQRLVRNLEDLRVQVRYTSLSLLDVHSLTEELNESLIQRLEERISDVHDHIANVSKRIRFTATLSSTSSSWNSGTLVLPEVITNVGNGYNPSTGIFTAPTAGEYVFFVSVMGYATQSIYVDVALNGVSQVQAAAEASNTDYYDTASNLAVLTLQKEDRVWVKYNAGRGYYNSGHATTFSGFLL